MKRYFVHVIEKSSIHEAFENDSGEIVFKISEGNPPEAEEVCEIVKSDAFYLVEASGYVDAVVSVSKIVRVQDDSGALISLSDALTKYNKENFDFSEDAFENLTTSNLSVFEKTNSDVVNTQFQIIRQDDDGVWIELHELTFYVVAEDKTIVVNSMEG